MREGRVEFCSYSEFAAPDVPGAWRNTWRELLGEVPVTKIEPAVSRAELGEDVFRNLEQSGALVRLCTRLKQGEWPAAGAGAPVYATPRFETGDERYRWLNRVQAVGKGVLHGSTLTYELYELR